MMAVENGYVPTPAPVADLVAASVFGAERPSEVDNPRLLLPGLGTGNLYAAVRRCCTEGENWYVRQFDYPMPECVGVEIDQDLIDEFETRRETSDIEAKQADFLLDPPSGTFDWVLANPPYTRYLNIPGDKRDIYRERFDCAEGTFPLYAPFLEQALRLVKPDGWVTFIIPVTALTIPLTEPLRELLRRRFVGPILYFPEETFDEQVTVCSVTVQKRPKQPSPLWVENVLAYGPRPLLKRLGVDDIEAAADEYMKQLKWYSRRIDIDYSPPQTAGDATASDLSGQADLRRWSL